MRANLKILGVLAGLCAMSAGARTTPLGSGAQYVHPGFEIYNIRPSSFQPRIGGMDFLSDGRMVVVHWGQDVSYGANNAYDAPGFTYGSNTGAYGENGVGPGKIYILSGVQGATDPSGVTVKTFLSGLWEPLGVSVGRGANGAKDTIFFIGKTGLGRIVDANGDDTATASEITMVTGICNQRVCADSNKMSYPPAATSANNQRRWHLFNFGLARDPQGYFYVSTAAQYSDNNMSGTSDQGKDRCALVKIHPSNGKIEHVSGGLRTPNGMGWGPEGGLFGADVEGHYQPAAKLNHWQQGRFYGMRCDTTNPNHITKVAGQVESRPVVWFQYDDIGNTPSQPLFMNDGAYKGQFLIGDVRFGGLQRVFVEKVDGEYQGAVMLFSGGLTAGVQRLIQAPDGSIYAGGISGGPNPASGNWYWLNNNTWGLHRIKAKPSADVFELLAVRSRKQGFELEFTKPLDEVGASLSSSYTLQHYVNLTGQMGYGVGRKQGGTISIASSDVTVQLSPDKRKVYLQIASSAMPAASTGNNNRVVFIRANVRSSTNDTLWGDPTYQNNAAAWYTLNAISQTDAFTVSVAPTAERVYRAEEMKVRRVGAGLRVDLPFAGASEVTLRDLGGRVLLKTRTTETSALLSTAALAKGTYLLEARSQGRSLAKPVFLF